MTYEYECEEVIKNVIKEVVYFKKGKNELAEKEIDEIYAKAIAFDRIKIIYDKNMNEMSISDTECIEMIGNEMERADNER